MSKKIRDYIFFTFVVLFVVGTIIVSLYASGLQINFSWPPTFNRLLIKTGMIAIKTEPEGAIIYLNDQAQTNFSVNPWRIKYLTTPNKVKNVLPGDYDLSLKLSGYLPLTKKITIYSGQTTFVEDINLFRSDLPQLIATTTASDLKLSSSYKYLYLPEISKIINLKTEQIKILSFSTSSDGVWLQNNDQLLIDGNLFNPVDDNNINYGQLLGSGASNWYNDEDQNRLYYQNENSLNYLNLNNRASTLIMSGEKYLSYEPRGENLFLVTIQNGQTVLQRYSLKTKKIEQELVLPTIGHYTFVHESRSKLTLYDDQNKTLYLINPSNITSGSQTISGVSSWQWRDDQTLFYNNDWEIYQLNLQTNNNSLLTRVGEKIVKIIWNKNKNYLIFSTANSLRAYDPKIGLITKIFTTDALASPALDDTSDTLYFWAKIGQQNGIYSLLLQ
ncbi:MAG: PEGA domain-containing protein [Patescibacteria group bacterium]|jgi:hypothetical protein